VSKVKVFSKDYIWDIVFLYWFIMPFMFHFSHPIFNYMHIFSFQFFGFESFTKNFNFFQEYIFKNSTTFFVAIMQKIPTKQCWLHTKYTFFDYILILYHVYYVSMHVFHHIKVNNFCEQNPQNSCLNLKANLNTSKPNINNMLTLHI